MTDEDRVKKELRESMLQYDHILQMLYSKKEKYQEFENLERTVKDLNAEIEKIKSEGEHKLKSIDGKKFSLKEKLIEISDPNNAILSKMRLNMLERSLSESMHKLKEVEKKNENLAEEVEQIKNECNEIGCEIYKFGREDIFYVRILNKIKQLKSIILSTYDKESVVLSLKTSINNILYDITMSNNKIKSSEEEEKELSESLLKSEIEHDLKNGERISYQNELQKIIEAKEIFLIEYADLNNEYTTLLKKYNQITGDITFNENVQSFDQLEKTIEYNTTEILKLECDIQTSHAESIAMLNKKQKIIKQLNKAHASKLSEINVNISSSMELQAVVDSQEAIFYEKELKKDIYDSLKDEHIKYSHEITRKENVINYLSKIGGNKSNSSSSILEYYFSHILSENKRLRELATSLQGDIIKEESSLNLLKCDSK